jgi:putative Holliday junction resolvase
MLSGGPVLALDVGTKTIGIALTDPDRRMAFADRTLARRSVARDTEEIAKLCVARKVTHLVVGLPLTLEGGEARSARLARQVADALVARTGLPLSWVDERFSTVEAERRLREAGVPAERRKQVIDQQAAVVILEDWLATGGSRPGE